MEGRLSYRVFSDRDVGSLIVIATKPPVSIIIAGLEGVRCWVTGLLVHWDHKSMGRPPRD